MTERFQGVVRLELRAHLRRLLASSPGEDAAPARRRLYTEVDEGELFVNEDGFKFAGRKGQLLGDYVRGISVTESVPVTDRVYGIKYGGDPSSPSKALFMQRSPAGVGPGLRERFRAWAVADEQDDPLLDALNGLLPSVTLSLAQYERLTFPFQCVCCLAPAAELRRCRGPGNGERYSFGLRLDGVNVMNYSAPAMDAPYCELHLRGFDACFEIQESQKILGPGFWRRWNEAELADPRLRDSRPYVNLHGGPLFGPASELNPVYLPLGARTLCWLGIRLDWIVSETGADAWDKEDSIVSLVLRFQNPAYARLFLSLNETS